MIPHLAGCYLTAFDIGCITLDGQPSIWWSITIQNGIGQVTTDSPLEETAARAIHAMITGRTDLFDDLLEDCRRMVIESKRTDSVSAAMRMAFSNHTGPGCEPYINELPRY